jgi:Ca2+/Na+ antiporter
MAVSNALGSNVFDILLCLGLPWVISTSFLKKTVIVDTESFEATAIFACVVLALFVGMLITSRWMNKGKIVLGKRSGFFYLVLYLVFVIFSV